MPREVTGEIAADRMYTVKALSDAGITRQVISEFRAETKYLPLKIGQKHWYYGKALIEWMLTKRVS